MIASIEETDREQGLFSDQPTNPHPLKISGYSCNFSEDFNAFKNNFREAARDNKISKTDQLWVLQDNLKGNAKHLVYLKGETSIDHAWSILEEAYGDPQKHTYRATSEASGRTLDIEAEHEEDIKTLADNARPTLEEAYGDPATHFHCHIRAMEDTNPLLSKNSDIETGRRGPRRIGQQEP